MQLVEIWNNFMVGNL